VTGAARGRTGFGAAARRLGRSAALSIGWALSIAHAAPPAEVDADAGLAPLTDTPGDPARGRAIVASRQTGLCLLCHAAPVEPGSATSRRFQGDLAPDLAGIGARLNAAQLRRQLVEPQRLNPQTIMPSYRRTDGLQQVGSAWQGRPILSAQQVEDVVAWLATLKD
jgi:sulfur-oxidizing protein SoxX